MLENCQNLILIKITNKYSNLHFVLFWIRLDFKNEYT